MPASVAEEKERIQRAQEAERRAKKAAEESRIRMEVWEREWAEEKARREREKAEKAQRLAREEAEREERERQALEAATVWWGRLSTQQKEELLAAVTERAWREEKLWVTIPENPLMDPAYAYGVPLYTQGKRCRSLYGIVRPVPRPAGSLAPGTGRARLGPQHPRGHRATRGGVRRTHHALRPARARTAHHVLRQSVVSGTPGTAGGSGTNEGVIGSTRRFESPQP